MNNKGEIGKYGLTGNSGVVAEGLHIAGSYDSNGGVFVSTIDDDYGHVWERVDKERAVSEGMEIISCSMCEKPAVSLDHHWPYFSDYCRCADHFRK